jgi:hypothetical protein
MRGWIKLLVLLSAFILTIYATSYISKLPESNCTTSPISSLWSDDRAYEATILKMDCNMSETIFYSVRIDAFSPPLREAWFTKQEIESDEFPVPSEPPSIRWIDSRHLEITMKTKTIGGMLNEHVGHDLIITRTYIASSPSAFPIFN